MIQDSPRIFIDGDQWCCLFGPNIQDGVCGFGDTPRDAEAAFRKAWNTPIVGLVSPNCMAQACEPVNAVAQPAGIWRYDPKTPEGKYLVTRRDGTIPEWPNFVIGAKDPNAKAALLAYADSARRNGMNDRFVADVYRLACEFEDYRFKFGEGDPDRAPFRKDDPETIAKMRGGNGS